MAKTIIFSFDGTGNEVSDAKKFAVDTSISNVLKLHTLAGGRIDGSQPKSTTPAGDKQVTHYYEGIGTSSASTFIKRAYLKVRNLYNQMFAPVCGDAKKILKAADRDFKKSYQPGDKIVIFGFSRGAALARKFASLMLKDPECKVSFLGVFDTVAAMNGIHRKSERIESDVVFEHGTLNKNIERAVHLVALDENRVSFEPTLINKDIANPQRILEIWFPGVHSDIGGGYWFDGLSDITLAFMIEQCKTTLGKDITIADGTDIDAIAILLSEQKSTICPDDISINPLDNGTMHKHSGLMTIDARPRKVVVNIDDDPSGDKALVHESVKDRFTTVPHYRPAALRNVAFTLRSTDDKTQDISGICGLRN